MPLDALLDDRKVTILRVIIKTYLETGESIGSRTTSKYSDLKLGSATIRNEMSDLEGMRYIIQPHTSTGRIPSNKGYRSCMDQIMLDKRSGITEFREMVAQEVDKLEPVLKKMAQMLAANTNYVTTTSGPSYYKTKLKFIQLSKIEKHKLLVVVVVEDNIIKNIMIDIEDNFSNKGFLSLDTLLNSSLNGLTIEEINLDVISKLKGNAGDHNQVVDLALSKIVEAIKAGEEGLWIYTSGVANIFKYPELSGGDKASRLTDALEHKEVLQGFVGEVDSRIEEKAGTQVYIGGKSPMQFMKGCSVVTADYDLGGGLRGTTGIVGPKWMDYEKVLRTLRNLTNRPGTAFKKDER